MVFAAVLTGMSRNFSRNWELSADFENKVDHPSLMICAANDRVLPPDMAVNMPKYIKDLETLIISTIAVTGHKMSSPSNWLP